MSVIAKFRCDNIEEIGVAKKISMRAVMPGDSDDIAEDERFHKYTPNGAMHMLIDNPKASDQFEIGKTYYVQIEEVLIAEPVPA